MAAFSHLDAGTAEERWRDDDRLRALTEIDAEIEHLVVIAAHPDDETLGAGGLIQRVHGQGGRVTVVVATDGEASHPDSPTHSSGQLRALRRTEVVRALELLAPGARLTFVGLPDGQLREHQRPLEAQISLVLDTIDSTTRAVVAAPWSGDGHRDHRIVAECVARMAAQRQVRHLGYPVWLWHWGEPDDLPWQRCVGLTLSEQERAAKSTAMAAHRSQVAALSDEPGDEAIISSCMHAHFERDAEVFVDESAATGRVTMERNWFEDFYQRHDDPWGFETRWYEERKRAITMASFPVRELGSVFEIGCATGLLTSDLAARATSVLAVDASERAVEVARSRVEHDASVSIVRAMVPQWWPERAFDTIVFSEVGYYLSIDDLRETIEKMQHSLTAYGYVLACHWRHRVAEYPLSGDQVHRALRAVDSWTTLALHEEEDFVLEVFAPKPAMSVAHLEGLR
ncbi:PIG-L family deacetylase (plasmid) [Coraliomargarita sp. W4R53]